MSMLLRRRGIVAAVGGGSPPVSSLSPSGSTTNSVASAAGVSVDKPTGTQEGDLLVASLSTRGTWISSAPAGWDLVDRDRTGSTSVDHATSVYAKFATDDEPASYSFSLESSRPASIACLLVKGADAVGDTAALAGTDGSGVAPAVDDGFDNALLYVCWAGRSMDWNDPAVPEGMAEQVKLTDLSNGPHQLVGTEMLDEDGVTGTRTSDVSTGGRFAHVSVVLLPPGVGGE